MRKRAKRSGSCSRQVPWEIPPLLQMAWSISREMTSIFTLSAKTNLREPFDCSPLLCQSINVPKKSFYGPKLKKRNRRGLYPYLDEHGHPQGAPLRDRLRGD